MRLRTISKLLMILGLFLPSILYPFAKPPGLLHSGLFGINRRITEYEIVIKPGTYEAGNGYGAVAALSGSYKNRVVIPYKYVIVLGTLLFFLGLSIYAFKPNENQNN